jgi:hypothetical protein
MFRLRSTRQLGLVTEKLTGRFTYLLTVVRDSPQNLFQDGGEGDIVWTSATD